MHSPFILACLLACTVFVPVAASADSGKAFVKVISPVEGAKLDAMEQTKLVYEAGRGPNGDHVHVYVDGKEVGILRQLTGRYTLETLASGTRDICVKVVNKAHVPIGVEQCVKVTVE
ncbi:MAG: hypothetical protein EPN62_11405 [Candidimonas sp.]|nr:MAG: hypothetical protein EPN77_06380 [Candidimonas sp.]TAM22618.1 MAG: hypothetical protein EPN62_11405 [Candidimonas sp.]